MIAKNVNIAQYIENDLKEKIRHGDQLPERLTLASIATKYDVSLTPVRAALANLIKSKLILKGENGRLEVNSRRRAKTLPPKTITEPELHNRNCTTQWQLLAARLRVLFLLLVVFVLSQH